MDGPSCAISHYIHWNFFKLLWDEMGEMGEIKIRANKTCSTVYICIDIYLKADNSQSYFETKCSI